MTEAEFQAYIEHSVQDYAQEHVQAGNWHPSEAMENAQRQFQSLLPDGLASKKQYLFTIEEEGTGSKVGMIWFAVKDNGKEPFAFVYDFVIYEGFRRRGYGTQAMRALEEQVKALGIDKISLHVFGHNHAARDLYEKAGYEITDITMSKKMS